MKFCNQCSAPVQHIIPSGDDRLRHVCSNCGTIHYENPRIIAGCIADWGDHILMCRRAIEPRRGYWTLPAGFMENGETLEQAARRETLEEACARLSEAHLYALYDLPHIHQVYVFFRGHLADPDIGCGVESLEVALFRETEIPWNELAFPTVQRTLRYYLADRRLSNYPIRSEIISLG